MFHIRTTKTASGATAVQVVRYRYRNRVVVKHIGSAHSETDIASLKKIAAQWIRQAIPQLPLRCDFCAALDLSLTFVIQSIYKDLYLELLPDGGVARTTRLETWSESPKEIW